MPTALLALFTAFCIGFFAADIIWTIATYSKAAHCKNRIMVKNASPWLTANWVIMLCFAVHFFILIFSLCKYDYEFTEKIFKILEAICDGTLTLNILFRMIFATRTYITDDGIIAVKAFFPKGMAKYTVEKSEVGTFIDLQTKNKGYDFCFTFKQKYEEDIFNIMDYLGYEQYDENNGTALNFKKQSYIKRNLIILLCAVFVSVGGLFGWYALTKPVVIVGDRIVKTNSEQAILNVTGCVNLLLNHELTYFPELEQNFEKIADNFQRTENLTSKDMTALKQMPHLKHLSVSCNDIDDLTDIGELTQLEMLVMGGGAWRSTIYPKDYSPLKNLTNLKYFVGLGFYNFNDLTVFENTDNLEYFELTAADIQTGLDVICEKENLLDLNLYHCTAENFSPIGKCVKLKSLVLADTNVKDLGFIENLTELEYLNIENIKAENYDKIDRCTKLKSILAENADITDLSFLKNLSELEYLEINNINAEDYSVLLELPSLKRLNADNCNIPNEITEKLTENGVHWRNY